MTRTWTRDRSAELHEPRTYRFYRSDDGWIAQRVGTGSDANPFAWMAAPSEHHHWALDADTFAELKTLVNEHADDDFSGLLSGSAR